MSSRRMTLGLMILALVGSATGCSGFGRKVNKILPEFLRSDPGAEEIERYQRRVEVINRTEEDRARAGEAFAAARALFDQELWEEASDALETYVEDYPDTEVDQEARWMLIRAYRNDDEPDAAAKGLREFVARFPISDYNERIEEAAFELAGEYVEGRHDGLFFSSTRDGIGLYRLITLNFPSGRHADEAHWRTGNFHFDEEEFVEAEAAYAAIVERYPESPWAARAQFNRALCFYRIIKGAEYDEVTMKNAVREFGVYLRKHPEGDRLSEARAYLDEVEALLCEKQIRLADWYESQGFRRAARYVLLRAKALYGHTEPAAAIDGLLEDLPALEEDLPFDPAAPDVEAPQPSPGGEGSGDGAPRP